MTDELASKFFIGSESQAQGTGMSRRQAITMLAASGAATVLAACVPAPTPETTTATSGPSATATRPQSEGYSIFSETMVDMPWPEVEKAAQAGAIVLLQTGVIEEHGPHMGLGVDTYLGCITLKLVQRDLEAQAVKALIAPPLYWGINVVTGDFPGSFTVRKETLKALVYDILASLKSWSFARVFNVNLHGDPNHQVAVVEAIREARQDIGIEACCVLTRDVLGRLALTGQEPYVIVQETPLFLEPAPKYAEVHAGGYETSAMLAYFPDQVDVELARTLKPTELDWGDVARWVQGGQTAREMAPLGYVGDPANLIVKDAKEYIEASARMCAEAIAAYLKAECL